MNKLKREEVKEFAFNRRKLPSRLVTRSQARKSAEEYCSILAYEDDKDKYLETSGTIPSQEKQEFDEYFTISACVEPVEEKSIEDVFATQDLVVPTNTTEALKDPIWKKSMDKESEALIEKKGLGSSIATSRYKYCWKSLDPYLQAQ